MTTKVSLVALPSLALAGFADDASAAAPAYCALYSREYAVVTVQPTAAPGMLQSIQDQAYYRCLNQDEDPQLPTASTYVDSRIPLAADATRAATSDDPVTSLPKPKSVASAAVAATAADKSVAPAADNSGAAAKPRDESAPPWWVIAVAAVTGGIPVATPEPASVYRGSGLPQWTAEWAAWCAKYFPRSWDATTGTVVHGSNTAGERVLCK